MLWVLIDPKNDIQKPQILVVLWTSLRWPIVVEIGLRERAESQLPDALCQQVSALIDLRLPNCSLIKERCCTVSFFLLILTLFIWFLAWKQLGPMCRLVGALCEGLVQSREFIFLPMRPFYVTARSERWLRSRELVTTACHRGVWHLTDRTLRNTGREDWQAHMEPSDPQ